MFPLLLRVGNLYFLKYQNKGQSINIVKTCNKMLWHRRYGHLGKQNLKSLVNDQLVRDFDYNASNNISFCESCVGENSIGHLLIAVKHTVDSIELVHSMSVGKLVKR